MKQKLLKLIAICLVLVSLVPYAAAAESGVNLWCQNDDIDLSNVVINVGDTITIGCDANDWASMTAPNHNHTVISVRGSGYGIEMNGTKEPGAGIMVSVTGVADGRATLTFTIQAGFSENPEEGDTTIDEIHSTTSVTIPITVIGEEEPEIYVQTPTIDIVDANGNVCSGSVVSQQEEDLTQFAIGLNSRHWTKITVMDSRENSIGVYAYDCRYEDNYTGYVLVGESDVRWSLSADEDEYQLLHMSNDESMSTASVLCRKDNASGVLTASVVAEKVVGGFLTGEQILVTQKVYLKSAEKEKELVAGELFEDVDTDKVPNPFADLSKDDWYYDSFMSLYAWGILDGIDFSENQDGSMILSMKKTVFDGSEEKVSATFVPESKWSAKKLSTANMGAVLHTLGSSPAELSLLANSQPSAFSRPERTDGRGALVQKVYNVEKVLGSISSYPNPFTDVSADKTYYQAVLWAANKGVVNGYPDGTFRPTIGITRQEFCVVLNRYAKKNGIDLPANAATINFKDAGSIGSWAKDAVTVCQKAGIINGYPDGSFQPNRSISMAEAGEMISKFLCK